MAFDLRQSALRIPIAFCMVGGLMWLLTYERGRTSLDLGSIGVFVSLLAVVCSIASLIGRGRGIDGWGSKLLLAAVLLVSIYTLALNTHELGKAFETYRRFRAEREDAMTIRNPGESR